MKRTMLSVLVCVLVAQLAAIAADELTLSVGWTYNKLGRKRVLTSTAVEYNCNGQGVVENVQTISTNTVADALVMGGVTNAGFAYFKNLGSSTYTNAAAIYIEIGLYDVNTNFVSLVKLATNETATLFLSTSSPMARSTTTPQKLDYTITDR